MRDLYASLLSVDSEGPAASIRFYDNPGIGLLWLGGLVAALGGVVAWWPSRARAPAPAVAEPASPPREEVRV
jgi:cytochrome c biogenesis factor